MLFLNQLLPIAELFSHFLKATVFSRFKSLGPNDTIGLFANMDQL